MERSFKKEVEALKLGDGETFRGEGILAVTKALLQSGVSYVGGYQGAPVSHLLDVMVDAESLLADLGVHVETCTNEASAAAMLGAPINYPLRGESSGVNRLPGPPKFNYARLSHPPVTFLHEKLKVEEREPAAQAFVRREALNEVFPGDLGDIGIITLGGLHNGVLRALERLGLADIFGNARVPIYCLNVAYPLIPEELRAFSAGKRAVLVVEEGYPDYVEQAVNTELRRSHTQTRVLGKLPLPQAREYTVDVLRAGLAAFLVETQPAGLDTDAVLTRQREIASRKPAAAAAVGELPVRPPSFFTGCPEPPAFT